MPKEPKETLLRLTKKDFEFDYFSGTGAGGQHRNKCKNSCRCFHRPSNSLGVCQDYRSKEQNTKTAWKRCVQSKAFQDWLKIEISRASGELAKIEEKVNREMENIKIEYKENGKWREE